MKRSRQAALAMAIMANGAAAGASETATYSYDVLGRLVGTSISGGPNAGRVVSTTFDPAGNRCGYLLSNSGTGSPAACPAVPGGGGGGTNHPPVAGDDSGSMTRCAAKSFAVLGNDDDPDSNLPLAVVGVSYSGPRGTADHDGTNVVFMPSGTTGSANVIYTMRDSLGATDSATLSITIVNGDCGPIE